MPLKNFFNPDSAAVIGAMQDDNNTGRIILENLNSQGFGGNIYSVNFDMGNGIKSFKLISDLPKKIDLAVLTMSAPYVMEAARECGEKKIKNLIIISDGFREAGSNGLKLEKELIGLAKRYDLKILGPNCSGIINTHAKLNAFFSKTPIKKGDIAFISQSEAICSSMLAWANRANIGFSKFISAGNMAVMNEFDFLDYLANDKYTKAVFLYLENFSDGKKFFDAAKKLNCKKPLIMLKAGITEKGKPFTLPHPGWEDKFITDGILKQTNSIYCKSLEEMFNLVKMVSSLNLKGNNNFAIIGNGGGINALMLDKISESSLNLINFEEEISEKLRDKLPQTVNVNNPLDINGDADAKRYEIALENILQDKNISNVFVILSPQTLTEIFETAEVIVKLSKKYKRNIVASFVGQDESEEAVKYLSEHNIPNFQYPENVIDSLAKLSGWDANKKERALRVEAPGFIMETAIEDEIRYILQGKTGALDYLGVKNVMESLKLQVIKSFLSADLKEINNFAQKNEYPFAMKALSSSIVHKIDAGAVKLGIKNPKDLAKAYNQLIKLGDKYKTKILVQPMIQSGIEIIVGAKRNNKFGATILFGNGGVYTELFKDVSLRISPLNRFDIGDMMRETKIAKILDDVRGEKIVDKEEIITLILKAAWLIKSFPQIKEFILNPIMVKDGNIYIVDARIIAE